MGSESVLLASPLFRGIRAEELDQVLACLDARTRRWRGGSFLLMAGQRVQRVGLLLEGRAQIVREDHAGNRTLVAELEPGDLFAEAFACAAGGGQVLTVSVLAAADCAAVLLDFRGLLSGAAAALPFQARLTGNLLAVMADKNLLLSRRLGHLSRRSTREKVLSYLSEQAVLRGADAFSIPFDRQELADYLCVERSALSAVLSALRREGVLDFRRNFFTLRGCQRQS